MSAVEFLPWYQSGSCLLRCSKCAALVIEADVEQHVEWHKHVVTKED